MTFARAENPYVIHMYLPLLLHSGMRQSALPALQTVCHGIWSGRSERGAQFFRGRRRVFGGLEGRGWGRGRGGVGGGAGVAAERRRFVKEGAVGGGTVIDGMLGRRRRVWRGFDGGRLKRRCRRALLIFITVLFFFW